MRLPEGRDGPAASPSAREGLLAAARKRFLLWGYSATSMATLADDLGVTKAALYYHFPDKEALFLAVFDDYLEGISRDLSGLQESFQGDRGADRGKGRGPALRAVTALALVFFRRGQESVTMDRLAFQESPQLSEAGQAALGEAYHRRLVAPLSAFFARAEGLGWLRSRARGEADRVWLFMGLLSAWFAPGHGSEAPPETLEAKAGAFATCLLSGVSTN